MSLIGAAAIGAGADLIGGAANIFSQGKSNYESRLRYDQQALQNQRNLIDQRNLETYRRDEDFTRNQFFRDQDFARQKEFATHGTKWNFDQLMDAADQSGIHRLAAIGGAGGSSYTPGQINTSGIGNAQAPSQGGYFEDAADFGFLGDAVSGALNRMEQSERDRVNQRRTEAETKLIEAQAKTLERKARAATTGGTVGETYYSSHDASTRPRPRPTPDNMARTPVYSPSGTGPHMIPTNIAERYNIDAYAMLSAGDVAELVGELAGEGVSAASYSQINKQLGGLLYSTSKKDPPAYGSKGGKQGAPYQPGRKAPNKGN